MHLVVGFILASILRKKASTRSEMPSIIGKLETIHALPGRVRFNSPLLEDLQVKTSEKIAAQITNVDGIERVAINRHSGSLLVVYNPSVIKPFIVHGIVIKLLGLEEAFEKSPVGLVSKEMELIGRSLNQQIVQSSGGLMDLRSSLVLSVLTLALYRILIQGDRTLPGGTNLLWWAYVMAGKRR
jgi:NACalpha-BTF3-like transcription factor